MKLRIFPKIFFIALIGTAPLLGSFGVRCIECDKKKQNDNKTLSIILSGIAQLANAFAIFFGNGASKLDYNEAVCNLVAGACTIAAQASKSHSSDQNPAAIYELLSSPQVIEAIKAILAQELGTEELQASLVKELTPLILQASKVNV